MTRLGWILTGLAALIAGLIIGGVISTILQLNDDVNGLKGELGLVSAANDANASKLEQSGITPAAPKSEEIIEIQGPPGPSGPVGIPGPQGLQGPKGEDGITPPCYFFQTQCVGAQGPQGTAGVNGSPGEPGLNGISGPQGEPGASGPQGEPGPQGIPGETGPPGPFCPTGYHQEEVVLVVPQETILACVKD